jgi:ribosomal protein L12E/L44/L45/RPP1/RPP2
VRSFGFFDDDGSGRLTADELQSSFAKMGLEMDIEKVKTLVEEIDDDGDGLVDVEEFVKMVTKEVKRLMSGNPEEEMKQHETRYMQQMRVFLRSRAPKRNMIPWRLRDGAVSRNERIWKRKNRALDSQPVRCPMLRIC